MKFPKKVRIKDPDLLRDFRDKPCAISNYSCSGPVAGHHLTSKGAGGDDTEENLLALCFFHHRQCHDIGALRFQDKYPEIIKKRCK